MDVMRKKGQNSGRRARNLVLSDGNSRKGIGYWILDIGRKAYGRLVKAPETRSNDVDLALEFYSWTINLTLLHILPVSLVAK